MIMPSLFRCSFFLVCLSLLNATALPLPPINPARYPAPIRVACVGDSITQGPDPATAYPAQLQELLGDDWQVRNFGVSGRTLLRQGDFPYWNEKAFQEAQAFNPDVVIIMLGTNDTKPQNWTHRQDFARDGADLVRIFQKLPAHPQIYLCRPTPVPEPGNYGINEAGILEEIKIIDRLVQELRIGSIDMHAALAGQPALLPDRVHPNAAGLGKMAAAACTALTGSKVSGEIVRVNSLFRSHAVLQRGLPVPIWGTAATGTPVTVQFAGQKLSTVARDGQWRVQLAPLAVNDQPQNLVISGPGNTITRRDILVGDVWVASGQSNMERELGPRGGQGELLNWRAEVARAKYPLIRQFYVPQKSSATPVPDAQGEWAVCSPETAAKFTAVGYYFARDLFQSIHVPIGLIHTSWGGTTAEVWTSQEALQKVSQQTYGGGTPAEQTAGFLAKNDPGSAPGHGWEAPDFAPVDWKTASLPQMFDKMGLDNYAGIVWFRKEIPLPATSAGQEASLQLGALDDLDTAWVNGQLVGSGDDWQKAREYKIPAGTLRSGKNIIAIRLVNTGGNGGWLGQADALKLAFPAAPATSVALAGDWQYQPTADFHKGPAWPVATPKWRGFPTTPSVLFNAMLSPLIPIPIRGVIWYQGESDSDRAREYRTTFPTLIQDWRTRWKLGDFPFLYVQIAPFDTMLPEIREAQLLTLARSPNTAMTVTTDCGNAHDIHPIDKEPVGHRLSLAARALAYGEKIEYCGPLYQAMSSSGSKIVLKFTHLGTGLLAKGGPLKGFTIAGADKNFVLATAEIRGDTVEVSSPQVASPKAVRYGWANVPEVNLFNKEGLPASPFRTDVE